MSALSECDPVSCWGLLSERNPRLILLKKKEKKRKMPEPRIKKEVRGLLGRLNYMSWFTSHLTATWEPIQEKRSNGQVK